MSSTPHPPIFAEDNFRNSVAFLLVKHRGIGPCEIAMLVETVWTKPSRIKVVVRRRIGEECVKTLAGFSLYYLMDVLEEAKEAGNGSRHSLLISCLCYKIVISVSRYRIPGHSSVQSQNNTDLDPTWKTATRT